MPVHGQCLNQFQAYYNLMRSRTQTGLASEQSRYEEVSLMQASDKPRSEMMKGCCRGFALCEAYMWATEQEAWWAEMLEHVQTWDGEYESLKDEVILPHAKRNKKLKLSQVFETVMAYVLGIQSNLRNIMPGVGDNVVTGKEQEYITEAGEPQRFDTVTHLSGRFTVESLTTFLSQPALKAMMSSKKVLCMMLSYNHATNLRYDANKGIWVFNDINHVKGLFSMPNPADMAQAIINILGNYLRFQFIPVDPKIDVTMMIDTQSLLVEYTEGDLIMDSLILGEPYSSLDITLGNDKKESFVSSDFTIHGQSSESILDSGHQQDHLLGSLIAVDDSNEFDLHRFYTHDEIADVIALCVAKLEPMDCLRFVTDKLQYSLKQMATSFSFLGYQSKWMTVALDKAIDYVNAHRGIRYEPELKYMKKRLKEMKALALSMGEKAIIEKMLKLNGRILSTALLQQKGVDDSPTVGWRACPELFLDSKISLNVREVGDDDLGVVVRKHIKRIKDEQFRRCSFAEFLVLTHEKDLNQIIQKVALMSSAPRKLAFMKSILKAFIDFEKNPSDDILSDIANVIRDCKPEPTISKSALTLHASKENRRLGLGPKDAPSLSLKK